jgi:hypothetical protein
MANAKQSVECEQIVTKMRAAFLKLMSKEVFLLPYIPLQ